MSGANQACALYTNIQLRRKKQLFNPLDLAEILLNVQLVFKFTMGLYLKL